MRRPLLQVSWKVNYIIDSTGKRLIIALVETAPQDYAEVSPHTHILKLGTPKISVENVPRKTLLNVGLLHIKAVEKATEEELISMNMVVHVSRDKQDEQILNKTILNPLE